MIEWIGIKFIKEIIRIMDFDFSVKLMTEFFGTALLLILGNGAVANVELKGTKGHQSGWIWDGGNDSSLDVR